MDVLGSDDDEGSSGDDAGDDAGKPDEPKPKAIDLATLERCGYTCVGVSCCAVHTCC